MSEKYADVVMSWLRAAGYTHCFFVAGGNSMHLLDGARRAMTCVPFVHEVAAGIAAEYFNEAEGSGAAFVLVTAGPGLTNLVTALAGAYLESRELLVLGGQVKSTDLAGPGLRQRGIQEVDGVALASPVTVASQRVEHPISRADFLKLVEAGRHGRPGPVFIEFCLDAQGAPVDREALDGERATTTARSPLATPEVGRIAGLLRRSSRPVWLLGGGVGRKAVSQLLDSDRMPRLPLMTTWNGADRVAADHPLYFGRPNTWGQRYANVLIQQADLIVAFGTRLGLQQTGFNWREFAPLAKVVQVDIDPAELRKGHPRVDLSVEGDADTYLAALSGRSDYPDWGDWISFCRAVRSRLPVDEPWNETGDGYLNPYSFVVALGRQTGDDDIVVPCSSGGAFTVTMQAYPQRRGQILITDKGLASMGYGLSGAIGAALAHPARRVVLLEGDGGFAQNLQELGTVAVNRLRLKIFIFANNGYASIRMTQRNYFGGQYLGCDTSTGLGFPDWPALFGAFGLPLVTLAEGWETDPAVAELFESSGPAAFIVPIDPEQTYFPKISSRITASGSMESQPLHTMSPDLPEDVACEVLTHLRCEGAQNTP